MLKSSVRPLFTPGLFPSRTARRSGALLAAGAAVLLAAAPAFAQPDPTPGAGAPAEPAPPPIDPEPEPTPDPTPEPILTVEPVVEIEPTPEAKPAHPPLEVSYDKGILFESKEAGFEARLALRNQIRFETLRPTEDGAQFLSRFSIIRSRLSLDGHVFGKDNRYKLELGLGDKGSFSFIKDLFVEKAVPGSKVWFRAGQWKRPFNRHELISDFAGTFNERSISAEFVGGGRDLGIALHNGYEKSPEGLEWVVGVFNGFNGGGDRPKLGVTCTAADDMTIGCTAGAPTTVPGDFSPAAVARVGWNTGGIKGYSEGDLEGGPLRVAVGLSYKVDLAGVNKGGEETVADNLSHGVGADALIKVSGLDVQLGGYMMKLKSADAGFAGFFQAGYFVMPKKAQVAGRFSLVPEGDRKLLEGRVAFNWYWQGHSWKWASDVGVLKRTGEDETTMATDDPDIEARTMLQLTF